MGSFYESLYGPAARVVYHGASLMHAKPLFHAIYRRLVRRLPDIEGMRGVHRGERCFILGNGPSLRELETRRLAHEYTFGVNGVFLYEDWLGFSPTYYVVEDRLVYEDRWQDICERVDESICLFPLQFSSPRFDRPNHRYFRALYEFDEGGDWPNFSLDPSRVVWIGGTVVYVCLQLALYMGFDPIYLIGVDLSYVKPEHISEKGSEWTSHGDDPNHCHPDYFGKGYRWHAPRTDRMARAFAKARRVADERGVRIRNAGRGGKLEAFERVEYDSLFGGAREVSGR